MKNRVELFNEVLEFIEAQRGEYKFNISEATSLQEELKIYGDDAAEFMLAFGKQFNVDVSGFPVDKYFKGEGWSFFDFDTYEAFTVKDLIDMIKLGV